MPDSILKDADRSKLDGIISQMVANKETDENIQLLVSDFKEKYGQKKNPDSSVSVSGAKPSFPGSGVFQTQINTAKPTVLTEKGATIYDKQVKDGLAKTERLSKDLQDAQLAYQSAKGTEASKSMQQAQEMSSAARLAGAITADRERSGNRYSYVYNKFLQGIGGAASGVADAAIVLAEMLPTGDTEIESGDLLKDYRENGAPIVRMYLEESVGAEVDKGKERQFDNEFVTSALGGLAYSAPAMISNYGIGLYSQAYDTGLQSINSSAEGRKLSEGQKTLYAGLIGTVVGALEKTGLERIFGKSAVSARAIDGLVVKAVDAAKRDGIKLTSDYFENFIGKEINSLSAKLLRSGKNVGEASVIEGITGSLQELATLGSERIANALTDKQIFDEQSLGEMTGRVLKAGAAEALGGGILGGVKSFQNSSTKSELVNRIASVKSFEDNRNLLIDIEQAATDLGLNEDEIAEITNSLDQYQKIIERLPAELPAEAKAKIIPLVEEREDIVEAMQDEVKKLETIDPAFQPQQAAKIEALNERVKAINNEISKGADIVNAPETVTTSIDVAPKVEPVPEPTQEQIPAKDSTPFKMYDRDMGVLGKDNDVADENIFLLDEKTGDVTLNKEGYEYGYSDPRYYWGDLFNIDFDLGDRPDFKDLQIVPAKIGNNGKVVQKGTLSTKEQLSKTNATFEQPTEIPEEQTNLDSKPQDDLLLNGEQVTGEPTNTDTAVETNQGAGAIDQAANNPDVSEVGGEVVNTVLQKAETDLSALKQVENKTAKYEGSIKRLTEAKNAGLITESEYNDTLNRFDDVMAEYTPKGAKSVNLNESIPDEVLDDVEVPKEVKQYHAKEKDRAVADIKAQWAKLSVAGIANNPIQQDKDVAKLIEAVSRYAYHAMMDGSIKISGKIANKVDEVVRQLGIEKVTKQQREAITEAIKAQVEKTKAELKEFAKPIKTVIKESTQVKSDFKEKDLISRLSQFKRRLADEVRGFKKGVKEGKSDAKEKQQSKDDIISGLREEIKLQIKEAKDSGLISNRIKPQTFVGAINRLNNAKTPMQLLKAIDYMTRIFADIDYDNHLIEANNLRSKVKKLAKRKGLPSNISEAIRNIARAVPEDLDDLVEYNKLLNSVIDNVNGASITGIDTGLLNDVANWLSEQHQKKTKERYELLVGEQGLEYESKTLEEMKARIDALNEEDYEGKDSRRDADEAVSELLREDLLDSDVSDYDHPQEIAAIEALKSLNISELSDKDLRLYNIAVNNLLLNGKLNGTGTLISVARKQKNFADKAKIADIQATTRAVSSWADKFRSGWATLPTQLKAFINNDRNLAKFYTITGLAEIKTGYTRVSNRITEVEKGIEKIIRKHKELRDVPKRQIEVAVYADLNQWDEGSTQEQIQEQFDGRKTALLETIDRLKEKSSFDVKFKKEHSNYIGLLEDVYDSIKGLKSVNDLTLQPGQMELYNYMRDYYDSIQDDTRLNAEIYNNINFKPVQNYFPRTYNKVDDLFGANAEKQMESKLLSESIFYDRSDIKKEESGSKQSRVIKKDQLPIDKVINLDLVSNFLNTARNVLYDIETQPARTYTANLLTSKQMRELTTDDSSIEITQRVANQLVKNQRLGILPQHSKTATKAMGEFYRGMGNRFALGGISQAVKQSASSYTTTMFSLGKNAGLLATSIHELIVNNEAANRLMEGMPISRRALEKSALTHVSIKESDVSKLNRSMEKHIVRVLDGWNDFADFMSLSPLIWGDLVSAKASWMAFYKDYLIKEGIIKSPSEFNLEKESLNRNAEAAEYAEQMTNTTLNSNDRTLQPEQKLGGWFPFTSFAINAKLNLAIDMARVSRKGIPMPERQKAARMVAGHIASSVVLNAISWGLRAYLITEAVDLVANFVKDDEEEEERDVLVKYLESLQDELLVRNSENTVGYIIKDIVFGGIISQVTDPVYNTIKEWITGEKSYDRPSDLIKIAGIYGIPASAIIQLGTKANDLMLPDEKFVQERFGIESADGSMLYVPIESRDKKRSDWARKSMASATALNVLQVLSSISNQEFANISRRLPLLVKKLEDKKYGTKRSLNPKNIEKDMAEITLDGKTYILSSEQIEFRKKSKAEFLKEYYKTIKENGTDKESEQLARSLSNTYAKNLTLYEFRDKLKEKE